MAVQDDPIKPKLKPPETKRLKPNCDVLLSNSAYKFNLRRYNVVRALSVMKNLKVLKIAENELGGAVAVERA